MSLAYFDFNYVNTSWISLFHMLVVSSWVLEYAVPSRKKIYDLDSHLISIMQGEIYLCDNDAIAKCVFVMLVTRIPNP